MSNQDSNERLLQATINGRLKGMKAAMTEKAYINATNAQNQTALHLAAATNQTDKLQWLIEKKANVNHTDNHGETALIAAIQYGHSDSIKLLVDAGIDVNIKDKTGNTALDTALKHYHGQPEQQSLIISMLGPKAKCGSTPQQQSSISRLTHYAFSVFGCHRARPEANAAKPQPESKLSVTR